MNDTLIGTVYGVLDDLLRAMGHRTDCRAQTSDSEVLTVGVIAACQFANHHERALCILRGMGYLSGPLSLSRFNRRFHALAHRLSDAVDLLAATFATGEVFVIDSVPLPVCRRARAWRCTKVRGAAYGGYCAAKGEKFFGWRLHLVVTPDRIPVSFRVPSGWHAARLFPRPDAAARVDGAAAERGDDLRGQGIQQRGRRGVDRGGDGDPPRTPATGEHGAEHARGVVRAAALAGPGGDGAQPTGGMGGATATRPHARRLAMQGAGVRIRPLLRQRPLAITVVIPKLVV
jgi:hypothetical protein